MSTLDRTRPGRTATRLSAALAVVVTATDLVTLLDPGLLSGPAAMRGSAVGTALVTLTVAVPLLLGSVLAARRGSALARITWLGTLAMLAYNGLMFLFATPVNRLFLLYVAWLALTVWSVGTLLSSIDAATLARRFAQAAPRRAVAAYIWVVVALNALAWLGRIVPAVAQGSTADLLRGTGLTTNVVYVQDLALWLPLMAVVAGRLWRGRAWGWVLAAAGLLMWCLESVSIAVDQAYGAAFDPTSPVASVALTPVFSVLAVVGLGPVLLLLNGFDGEGLRVKMLRAAPPGAPRTATAWLLGSTTLTIGVAAVYGGLTLAAGGWDLPRSWLAGTPFTSWTGPGLALLVGVAAPQLLTCAAIALGSPYARWAAVGSAVLLVAWIAIQLVVLQRTFFLQPVVAVLGLGELALARRWRPGRPTDGQPVQDLRPETSRIGAATVKT